MALKPTTGLETHPVGTAGLNSIINANWDRLEAIFLPLLSAGHHAEISWDPTNKKFDVKAAQATVTYAANVTLDLDGAITQFLTLAGICNFTTSNRAAGLHINLIVFGDGSSRNLTWPAGWRWVGLAAPAALAANKTLHVEIYSTGTLDTGIVARAAVQA